MRQKFTKDKQMNNSYKSPPPDRQNANDTYKSNLESAIPPQSLAKVLAKRAKQNRALNSTAQSNETLPAIVAGSGPSLKAIDYSRMPLDFEVFRCNQFYFEDKYYLGKRVKGFNSSVCSTFFNVWTMLNLLTRNEYEVDKIFLGDSHDLYIRDINGNEIKQNSKQMETIHTLSYYYHKQSFIDRIFNGSFSYNIVEFLEWSNLASIYYGNNITSGILCCALAVAMGHREIYIAGIDFYDSAMGAHYFTSMRTPNIMSFTNFFVDDEVFDEQGNYKLGMRYHTKLADIEGLYFLQEVYGVKFYSLCESSPISELIPLAKKTNSTFTPEPKPKDYICDFCIPTKEAFALAQVPQMQPQTEKIQKIQHLKQNIYFRLLCDLFKLPSHIKYYIKGKIAKEKAKKLIAEYNNER